MLSKIYTPELTSRRSRRSCRYDEASVRSSTEDRGNWAENSSVPERAYCVFRVLSFENLYALRNMQYELSNLCTRQKIAILHIIPGHQWGIPLESVQTASKLTALRIASRDNRGYSSVVPHSESPKPDFEGSSDFCRVLSCPTHLPRSYLPVPKTVRPLDGGIEQ